MTQDIAGLCEWLKLCGEDEATSTIERLQAELEKTKENASLAFSDLLKDRYELTSKLAASQDRVAELEEALSMARAALLKVDVLAETTRNALEQKS